MNLFDKIIVLGSSCSGKTTLGQRLAIINQAKHIDLDDLNWLPGWKARPSDELNKRLADSLWGESKWIITGNYRNTHSLTMPMATSVVWLDFPLRLILWRMLKRTLQRILRKELVCNGNYETVWGTFFDKDNLFAYTIRTYKKRKEQFSGLQDTYPHLKIFHIESPKALELFVAEFQNINQVD